MALETKSFTMTQQGDTLQRKLAQTRDPEKATRPDLHVQWNTQSGHIRNQS